jgi:long-subunit acyl-CoA synthetase (AMP-forming)
MFEICYTSGTTGLPKGAMLTHKNIVCLVQAATDFFVNLIFIKNYQLNCFFSSVRFSLI